MRILCAVGARPNFVKIAPILRALEHQRHRDHDLHVTLVHTGQHYDSAMSDTFFADLGIRPPDLNLGVGSGSHAEQTAKVLMTFDRVLAERVPDLLLVVGDVNSTLACALAAAKRLVPVGHVEAGLRSADRTMPEEVNRILTDAISDLCFTSCAEAGDHLLREGVPPDKVFFVGNVMIDTLVACRPRARRPRIADSVGLTPRGYAVLTLHRPSNVDRADDAARVLDVIASVQRRMPVVFPIHPRSRDMFERHGLRRRLTELRALHLVDSLGYLEFLYLVDRARVVLTDSGG